MLAPSRALANRYAVGAVLLTLGLQLASVSFGPLMRVLGTVALTAREWMVVAALAAVPAVIGQSANSMRRGS